MTSGGHNRKVSVEHRAEIMRVYVAEGHKAAQAMCDGLGLSPRYASSIASSLGIAPKRKKHKLTEEQRQQLRSMRHVDDSNDPRWAWAIERGAVTL